MSGRGSVLARAAVSAGVLPYRRHAGGLEVLLVHPGGPFWRGKDKGSWQIVKGLIEPGETSEAAARREAEEELGMQLAGTLTPLPPIRQTGGKRVAAFALEADLDPSTVRSNSFEMEWPPRSGKILSFPEIDAARWFPIDAAAQAMLASQTPLLDALRGLLDPPPA